ncbi:MAG TPA: TerB family tellurite resistance protein [Anaerolineales bacterium]|nr:TerB family tellurite resistance protein [Anaerolineales bacterium]
MNRKLMGILAKVIAAAGWADKTLTPTEIENLKDLLFQFQRSVIDPREDALYQMYIKSPVDAEEQERLVEELRETVWSEEDKIDVHAALKRMVEADGKITDEEQALLDDIHATIESVDTGMLGKLGRLVRGTMQRRSQAVGNTPNREKYFEDFLKNKVYYEVRRRLDLIRSDITIPDEELRKLSLVGGMMAHVARVDHVVLENETEKITSLLQTTWGLSREAAIFVMECAIADVSRDFDYLRMTREFTALTTAAERNNLLGLLFAVANADGDVSDEELLEITYIADYLLLSLDRLNRALLKVSR